MYQILIKYTKKKKTTKIKNENRGRGGGVHFKKKKENLNYYLFIERFGVWHLMLGLLLNLSEVTVHTNKLFDNTHV